MIGSGAARRNGAKSVNESGIAMQEFKSDLFNFKVKPKALSPYSNLLFDISMTRLPRSGCC